MTVLPRVGSTRGRKTRNPRFVIGSTTGYSGGAQGTGKKAATIYIVCDTAFCHKVVWSSHFVDRSAQLRPTAYQMVLPDAAEARCAELNLRYA